MAVAVGVTVLACAGCSSKADSADAPSATKGTTTSATAPPPSSAAPKPTPKPSPVALNRLRGDYWAYYKSGTNWDAKNNRFTENCSYAKLDRFLDGSYTWSLTLKSLAGNTTESETEAF